MILGKLIFECRKQRELSLTVLAKRIGIDRGTLWRFEHGEEIEGTALAKLQTWCLSAGIAENKKAGV